MISIKSKADVEKMRRAGVIVADILRKMRELVRPGIDTLALDTAAEQLVLKGKGKAAFKGYRVPGNPIPFPGTICVSINDEVVHGIPRANRFLDEGDIISVDVGVALDGFYADAACTYAVGTVSEARQKLLDVTLESLHQGISVIKPKKTVGDIGQSIEAYVLSHGCGLVRDYAGHGIGRKLHEAPQIPNYGHAGSGVTLKPYMTFCVEPMVMAGKEAVKTLSDGWAVVTEDGSDAAHFEHTILVTEDGAEILTPWE